MQPSINDIELADKAYNQMRESQRHDANKFDLFLQQLETTKQQHKHKPQSSSSRSNKMMVKQASSDNSSAIDSLRYTADKDDDERRDVTNKKEEEEVRLTAVDSFIERYNIKGDVSYTEAKKGDDGMLHNNNEDTSITQQRKVNIHSLPDAILKLDRRQDIPTPQHKNDVLVEIEASTVDRRDLMVRPGVRCAQSLPQGVQTVAMECIGHVVQLNTHARAIYGLSIDDRVAAIYPFLYNNGYNDKQRLRNKRYALVDGGFVVNVPKHVDAAEAVLMIRLYISAFQSILKGLSYKHDRYGSDQLQGQSILIQYGHTELGRVLIELAIFMGASQIFATAPSQYHDELMDMGVVPLGTLTFNWELFLEEKISLVIVQEMPTADNFEQFISILDQTRGNMVYIHHGHKEDGDDLTIDDFSIIADNVGCTVEGCLSTKEINNKVKEFTNSVKFSLRLTCTSNYIVYEGVWPSVKENPNLFRDDLRYLFSLLDQGDINPVVNEICTSEEEVADIQNRIELVGKNGTIVCLPTALFEKKAHQVVSYDNSTKKDHFAVSTKDDQEEHGYATDSGYVNNSAPPSDLSDFHSMRSDTKMPASPTTIDNSLPALPETSAYTNARSNYIPIEISREDDTYNENASAVSSLGTRSVATGQQTSVSDGVVQVSNSCHDKSECGEDLPPISIQFGGRKSRHSRAHQRKIKARESWKQAHKKRVEEIHVTGDDDEKKDDKSVVSVRSTKSTRALLRRERSKKERNENAEEVNVVAEKPTITRVGPVAREIVIKKRGKAKAAATVTSPMAFVDAETIQFSRRALRKVDDAQGTKSDERGDNHKDDVRYDKDEERSRDNDDSFANLMNKWKLQEASSRG